MKRLVVLLALITATVVACRQYLPSNRYLQLKTRGTKTYSTADARGKFSHALHWSTLKAANITCVECHRFDALIEASDVAVASTLSMQALHPGGAACHYCHQAGETHHPKAPEACTTCHEDLRALLPQNHQVAWLKTHSGAARANPEQCTTCHRQTFCINCHQRRDSIQTVVHERNFRFFHGAQARANPMQCGSCHREDFCIRCHQRGEVEVDR